MQVGLIDFLHSWGVLVITLESRHVLRWGFGFGARFFVIINTWQSQNEICLKILKLQCQNTMQSRVWNLFIYRQVSNIRRTLVRNKLVDHSDVVGASPVGAAPTTSEWST